MSRWKIVSGYEWSTWAIGLMRSFVAGGAGALSAPIGPMIMDAGDYNLSGGLHKVLATMGIAFVVTGLAGMGIFLKTHGAPDAVVTTVQTVTLTQTSEMTSKPKQEAD